MRLLLCVMTICVFGSCTTKKWFQLYEVKCKNCIDTVGKLISSRDSIFIEYNFWGKDGYMNFTVHNNSSKPIYIDWKRSGYYKNGILYKYWEDVITGTETRRQYVKPNDMVRNPFSATSVTYSDIYEYRPERVSYVINNSAYKPPFVYQLVLGPIFSLPVDKTTSYQDKPKNGESGGSSTYDVYMVCYKPESSILTLRNYITWTYQENEESGHIIDNTFYIGSIQELVDKNYYEKSYYNVPSIFYRIIDRSGYSQEDIHNGVIPY